MFRGSVTYAAQIEWEMILLTKGWIQGGIGQQNPG